MTKYRIGVDARLLSEPVTGIGRYTYETLSRLTHFGHRWFLYSHKPIIIGVWDRANVNVRSTNLPGRLLRMLWAQSILPMWAAQDKLDLFWSPAHRLPRLLPSNIARVVTIHDLVWKHAPDTMRPLSRWLDSKLMPEAVKLADKVIGVSDHTCQDIVHEMPCAIGKVVPIALGTTKIHGTIARDGLAKVGLKSSYFLFVGTLEPRKNLARLLEAYSLLPAEVQNHALLVIVGGKGWGGVDVINLASSFGIKNRVHVLGYVSDELLANLYTHALFLAMPSLYEGFGLPLLEAMSRGIPVFTSNCSSMPEVAGDAGYLVDPHDVGSISSGLFNMICRDEIRNKLAERSIGQARRFSWDKTVKKTVGVFEGAIEARREKIRAGVIKI